MSPIIATIDMTRKCRFFLRKRTFMIPSPEILMCVFIGVLLAVLKMVFPQFVLKSHNDTPKVLTCFSDEDHIMFKRQPSDIQFIAVTLVLVVLLGARTFYSLTEEEEVSVAPAVASQSVLASNKRTPASVPQGDAVSLKSALEQFTSMDLNCSKKGAFKVSVRGNFVQFQGKSCVKGFNEGQVEIVNKSNGYTASIFPRGTDKYQTDLIQLQNGDNEIAIRYRERSGKSVEEVVHVTSINI